MRNHLLFGALLAGFITGGFALSYDMSSADAGGGKNLKVYPKSTDKKQIKKDMKAMSKALGVQCDYCHDMGALDKDSDMKEKARKMMRMTNAANAALKKDGFKAKVTCNTCHQGKKTPKK